MTTRRDFLRQGGAAAAALFISAKMRWLPTFAAPMTLGLSDPALQPKFANLAPNALDPGFKYIAKNWRKPKFTVDAGPVTQMTGLVDGNGHLLPTPVWGYGEQKVGYTWPGRTFEVQSGIPVQVTWRNMLLDKRNKPLPHLLPVDTSLHWAYSLPGYEQYSIADPALGKPVGVPIVTHVHGGHSDSPFDGNPEYFFSPKWKVRGPRWVTRKYVYCNDQPAGNLWYHDHGLGLTRLNVYAGLAGFYFVRDEMDTGKADNPLGLPAFPYELAYAIQDRMFRDTGELFYSAFPGDPFYDDFITGEGAVLPPDTFPSGGPTALAEFFGDHMVVNGMIWPKANVEPRHYRMHLLNGCDSRFLVVRFRQAAAGATTLNGAGAPLPFTVIGSDQGLAGAAATVDTLIINPGERYDLVFDFSQVTPGSRVIMENIGGDAPFGGAFGDDLDPLDDLFPDRQTDRIMAFDVALPLDTAVPDAFDATAIHHFNGINRAVTRTRKVALFEGMDEYGRLQPLLGTAEPATDYKGRPVIGMAGTQLNGATAWHEPTSENPRLGATEIWEVYNATMDAHPVHLHLVHFEILDRQAYTADAIQQPVMQHNGAMGMGFRLENLNKVGPVMQPESVENAPKDMVTAYPGQVTRIKATFDKPGRYVWHCHILSHEDHEMMRVLHVGKGA